MTRQSVTLHRLWRPFTGWHMLGLFVAFFGVVLLVNVAMARLALSTFSGEVVKNSYDASQRFNGWLDRARIESALGWHADLATTGNTVVLTLTEAAGQPVRGAALSGHATHPLGAAADLDLRFVETAPGVYAATLPAGRWQIHLLAQAGGHSWHHLADVTSGRAR
jgi:nitrogen fixation protein FixH